MEAIAFYLAAVLALFAALMVVLHKNPAISAVYLVLCFFAVAANYVLLHAHFIAAIQVLVYAGAVMVLFLFVIMLLNLGHAASDIRGPSTIAATVVIAGLLAGELFVLARYTPARLAAELAQAGQLSDPRVVFAAGDIARHEAQVNGVVGAIAAPLFQTYLVPFEITSILLLVAIIGAVVLAKRKV
jgi:NADH-quinone oxidoreductase subunit J